MVIENNLISASITVCSPFLNILCYILLGMTYGWQYALATFIFLLFLIIFAGIVGSIV
jgi:hypothetical protein